MNKSLQLKKRHSSTPSGTKIYENKNPTSFAPLPNFPSSLNSVGAQDLNKTTN